MKKHLSKLSYLVIGLSLAATVSYLNAWTGPTETAPAGNVGAPVNLSALSQIKLGGLSVASLLSTGAIGASQYCDALGQNCSTPPFGGSSVPAGTVAAFNLTTCPAGWIPADGTNGTRDLRGYFIRGYGTNSDGTTSGTFGVNIADTLKSHSHPTLRNWWGAVYGASGPYATGYALQYSEGAMGSTNSTGDAETRPKNVALLYCQKDGTSSGGGSVSSDPFKDFKTTFGISNFPSYVVCNISATNRDLMYLSNVDDVANRVSYELHGIQSLGYNKTTGARTAGATYCPAQLALDGRVTQF